MPELPEVETVRKALEKNILKHKITEVIIKLDKIVKSNALEFVNHLINNSFKKIDRRGKWLIMELEKGVIVSHLRMEGRYYYKKISEPMQKHEHIIINFDNDMSLRYYDVRQFGTMHWFNNRTEVDDFINTKIGFEPWDINTNTLSDKLKNKNIAIKTALLDQKIITGLGNIYVDEVLFLSKVNPETPARLISNQKLKTIIENSRKVLSESIEMGGTTIRTFTSEMGKTGHYQTKLLVHTKVNEPCSVCGTIIKKIKVNGRGAYYCPKCQKRKING